MSRFILGDCIDVMRGFPDRAVDLIVLRTVQAARLPATSPMNGWSQPPLRCTACSKKTP